MSVIYTFPAGSTLWNGFTTTIVAVGGAVTLTIASNDSFVNQPSGASFTIPNGFAGTVVSNGATNAMWYVRLSAVAPAGAASTFGQCRLETQSSTALQLLPSGGSLVTIAGLNYALPSSGVTSTITSCSVNGTAAQTLSANTLYYVYLFVNSGVLTLDFSTTGHSTDTTAGNAGVEIKTGDNSRTLVGMVYPLSGPVLVSGTNQLVSSWFNRLNADANGHFTTARTTTSSTYAEINSEIRCGFLAWAGDAVQLSIQGSVYGPNGAAIGTTIGIDGVTPVDAGSAASILANSAVVPIGAGGSLGTLSEGYHYATLLGLTTSGTATWSGNATAGSRTAISVVARG